MKVLIIEDNISILDSLEYTFKKNGFQVSSATTIKEAENILSSTLIDLIILDISLPDGNGFNLYKNNIKEKNIDTIFLTAIDDDEKIVSALNLGAEDYITKPFSIEVLLARVNKIVMRREKKTIIKKWKTCKHRYQCLLKLGVSKEKAKRTAYSRASYWHNSKSIVVSVAISNERLKRKGLVFPLDHYLKVHTVI